MSTPKDPQPVPLLFLGTARRRVLQERLSAVVRSWYQAWAGETATEPSVTLTADPAAREPRSGTVTLLARRDNATLITAVGNADVVRILLGVGAPEGALAAMISPADGLSLSLAEGVVRALCGDILKAAFPGVECVLERQRVSHSNSAIPGGRDRNTAVHVSFGKGRAAIELALAPELVDVLAGPRPAAAAERLTPRRHASGEERVRVSAVLGTATVSWRDLTALAAGHVIVLDQLLDSPGTLEVPGRGKVAEVQIGAAHGSLAVQVTRIS